MKNEEHSFDIFSGSETGFLKACSFQNKIPVPINKVEEPKKELSINCLSWGSDERLSIYTGCRYGRVFRYCLKSSSCLLLNDDEISSHHKMVLKDMRVSDLERTTILAFGSGKVKITKFNIDSFTSDSDKDLDSSDIEHSTDEINAGADLFCCDQNLSSLNQILTGGKKNQLKIWDVQKPNEAPIFTAKNVKNDWLNLHVPIWITKAQFIPNSKKVITGTGYSQIRLYDTSSSQRRPVIEMKYEENPITAMAVKPGIDHQVVVGNTIGNIGLLDLRNKSIVKGYKGSRGGVTDIQFHPKQNVFASCGVDRFVNCYDLKLKEPIYSVYMHSSLNCLLFTSDWTPADDSRVAEEDQEIVQKVNSINSNDTDESEQDEGIDDILKTMDVVKTKKKRKLEEPANLKRKKGKINK